MHNNSATTRRGPKRTSTATSASRKPPANSELRWKNASESVSSNIPGTAPNGRYRASVANAGHLLVEVFQTAKTAREPPPELAARKAPRPRPLTPIIVVSTGAVATMRNLLFLGFVTAFVARTFCDAIFHPCLWCRWQNVATYDSPLLPCFSASRADQFVEARDRRFFTRFQIAFH